MKQRGKKSFPRKKSVELDAVAKGMEIPKAGVSDPSGIAKGVTPVGREKRNQTMEKEDWQKSSCQKARTRAN